MRTPIRFGLAAAIAVSVLSLSCGKNEKEAQKFNRASDENFHRDMSDLTSFKLANGITVYMQEERTDNQVAISAVYRAGHTRDPKGKFGLAHLTEHMTMSCASGPYKAGETMSIVKEHKGMISAEAVADFIHVDYVVDAANLDEALTIEASRLQELQCDQATLDKCVKDVVAEVPNQLKEQRGNLTRVAMAALTHIIYHGEKNVPMQAGVAKLTLDDVHRFHDTFYRPDDMVLVMIGNFKKPEAEAMVRKHFEAIPSRPATPDPAFVIKSSTRATWDIPAQCVYYVSPGPYNDPKERMILTMFGAFLQQMFSSDPDIYNNSQAIYSSNQSYPVGRLPFFVFVQAKEGFTVDRAVPAVFSRMDQAVEALQDDRRVEMIKTGMISFVASSSLKEDEPDYPMMHYQVIGQEGLNVCLRHMARDGRSLEEFTNEVSSVTPDEFRAVIAKRLARTALITISINPRS